MLPWKTTRAVKPSASRHLRPVRGAGRRNGRHKARVGHEGTAKVLSGLLEDAIEVNRASIALQPHDSLLVAQPIAGRLAPGQELTAPDLAFFKVIVLPRGATAEERRAATIKAEKSQHERWLDELASKLSPAEWVTVARRLGVTPHTYHECHCGE